MNHLKRIFLFHILCALTALGVGLASCAPATGNPIDIATALAKPTEAAATVATTTPIPTKTTEPTKTPIPATSTPEATAATAIETQQSEAGHIKWERVEANREAVNDYVFVDTIFDLNKDGAYFKEYGITTKEQLKQFLEDNGGYFPASQKKNSLNFFGLKHQNFVGITTMTPLQKG